LGRGAAGFYNFLSWVFLILGIVWVAFVITRFAAPPPPPTAVALAVPTLAQLPTETLTFTPSQTFTPTITFTPTETFTVTMTPTITETPEPSVTLSETPTLTVTPEAATVTPRNTAAGFSAGTLPPSFTPFTPTTPTTTPRPPTVTPLTGTPPPATNTLFPSVTPSLEASQTVTPTTTNEPPTPLPPLGETPSPFPFTLREPAVLVSNFANSAGCLFQGVGGQVFDVNDAPLLGVRVHVIGPGIDVYTTSGSNTLYGASGFEVPIGTGVTLSSYIVELQSPQGTVISDQVRLDFTARCDQNVGVVNFKQTRPF